MSATVTKRHRTASLTKLHFILIIIFQGAVEKSSVHNRSSGGGLISTDDVTWPNFNAACEDTLPQTLAS